MVAIDFAFLLEVAVHRIADADAADQQSGQADDGEKLGEALDVALERRRGVVARANFPAGLREALARLIGDALVGIARRRLSAGSCNR